MLIFWVTGSHTGLIVTQWRYCKQSKDWREQTYPQPLLLRSEISLFWRTSCAIDFFSFFLKHSLDPSLPILNVIVFDFPGKSAKKKRGILERCCRTPLFIYMSPPLKIPNLNSSELWLTLSKLPRFTRRRPIKTYKIEWEIFMADHNPLERQNCIYEDRPVNLNGRFWTRTITFVSFGFLRVYFAFSLDFY